MRIKLGNDHYSRGVRSYLDAADDIVALPLEQLMRISRVAERFAGWPDDCPKDRVPEFLDRVYSLASQI